MFDKLKQTLYDASPPGLQNLAVSRVGLQHRRWAFGHHYHEWRAFLSAFQQRSEAQQREHQDAELRELIRYAYLKVPFYTTMMDEMKLRPSDFRTTDDLMKLPILAKSTFRQRSSELLSSAFKKRQLFTHRTSGTTGAPITVWWSAESYQREYAHVWHHRGWFGLTPNDLRVTLDGHRVVPIDVSSAPFHRFNWAENQVLFSIHHLRPSTADAYARAINSIGPTFIHGYASPVYLCALATINAGLRTTVRAVFAGSEMITQCHRRATQEAFVGPLVGWYGNAELCGNMTECEAGAYHLQLAHSIHEVVNEDGVRVEPGQSGRLVATSLLNRAMPLIRYDTGDVVTLARASCTCGRQGPIAERIDGRTGDFLLSRDGRIISAESVVFFFMVPDGQLCEAQVVQDAVGDITVRVVPGPHYCVGTESAIRGRIRERMGDDLTVCYELTDHIGREPSGKFQMIKSNVVKPDTIDRFLAS